MSNAEPQNDNERAVVEFLHSMGPTWDAFVKGYQNHLTDDALWENTGFPGVQGKDNAIAFLTALHQICNMEYCTIDIHHISSRGDTVLTERTDRMHRPDGSVICEFRIMGAFTVRDGKIARYSDYFDTTEVRSLFPALAAAG